MPADGDLVSLRLLRDRREELTNQRTEAMYRLHRLLAALTVQNASSRGRASTATSPGNTALARSRENGTGYH